MVYIDTDLEAHAARAAELQPGDRAILEREDGSAHIVHRTGARVVSYERPASPKDAQP